MNWNRVINVFLLIFALLNIFLWRYQIQYEENRYTINQVRKDQLSTVLSNNGISSYVFLPEYYPTSQLELEAPSIDKNEISTSILGDDYTRGLKDGMEVHESNLGSITYYTDVKQSYIFYKGSGVKYLPKDLTSSAVDQVAKEFARDLFGKDVKMEITVRKNIKDSEEEAGYQLEMNEIFRDKIIFQTFIKLRITRQGIMEALAVRYKPLDYYGNNKNIYPYDEAIYSLIYYMKENETQDIEGEGHISDVDIGYYIMDVDTRRYEYQVDPYYRIIFSDGSVYYINAYTNDVFESY